MVFISTFSYIMAVKQDEIIHMFIIFTNNLFVRHIPIGANCVTGRRRRDRMVVGFTTTNASSDYHH
jgi:hypothetical protein